MEKWLSAAMKAVSTKCPDLDGREYWPQWRSILAQYVISRTKAPKFDGRREFYSRTMLHMSVLQSLNLVRPV
jgi:hypothetical protein